jgi:undecaprenyl-diphosphatase
MTTIDQPLMLGAVQGISEFLPVSSSAHLVLLPWLFNWQDQGLAFDVALHLGTLLALLVYYWRDWTKMAASVVGKEEPQRRLLLLLITASIPGSIIGFLFEKQAETTFRSPLLIAVPMAGLGLALWLFDWLMPKQVRISQMTYGQALLVGCSQALAVIPGVSRSGATITMGRILGMEREDAANFSFLMATPIIAGAGLFEARKLAHIGLTRDMLVGFCLAAVLGIITIRFLIRFVRTRTYAPFAWYRLIVSVGIAVVFLTRHPVVH